MYTVGVTGGMGSGKSTVCSVFEVLGISVFSSDDAGKRLLQEDPVVRAQVIEVFGEAPYVNGLLNRKALAALVFGDPVALARLNAIVHPAVRHAFRDWAKKQEAPYVINEAAILVESGGHTELDHLIVVTAPDQERVARVMKRDGLTEEAVRQRLRHQTTDETRAAVAHSIIVNDGVQLVIPQVLAVHEALIKKAKA
ncbi:MAG: dephospho-CoA kinase [Flavobacteriales bacterium]